MGGYIFVGEVKWLPSLGPEELRGGGHRWGWGWACAGESNLLKKHVQLIHVFPRRQSFSPQLLWKLLRTCHRLFQVLDKLLARVNNRPLLGDRCVGSPAYCYVNSFSLATTTIVQL